jgi:hypothetical protein
MQRRAALLPVLLILGALAPNSGCRRESGPDAWAPAGVETRQNPLLLPIDGMADVTKLCSPPPCANGSALRAAIVDALGPQNKRALYFPPGEHTITQPILVPSNTTIAGLGATSIIRRTGTGDGSVFRLDGVSHVTISNLHFYTHKAGEAGYARPAIELTSASGNVSTNIRIVNNLFIADATHPSAYYAVAINADGTAKLSESWITNNFVKNSRLFSASLEYLRNLFITDNKLEGAPNGGMAIQRGSGFVRYENILVANNNFSSIVGNGFAIGANDGAVVSGRMHNIKVTNNSISMTGSSVTRGIWLNTFQPSAGEQLPNRNIAITGNTVTQTADATTAWLTGIALDRAAGNSSWADNVLISGNTIRADDGRAINRGVEAYLVRNSIIADNTVGNPSIGIYVDQHEGLLVKGNNLNAPSTDAMSGIFLGYGSDAMVTGNVVTGRTGRPQGGVAALLLINAGLSSPKNTFSNILVRGNRFVGLGTATCAVYQESATIDARYYSNDMTSNLPICGYSATKVFVDNLVDPGSADARLARHFTKSASVQFDLSAATFAVGEVAQVTGAREGDSVAIGVTGLPTGADGVTFHGHVSENDKVKVRAVRHSASPIPQFTATVRVSVLQYAN